MFEGLDLKVRVLTLACQGNFNVQFILIFKGLVILIADLKYGAPTVVMFQSLMLGMIGILQIINTFHGYWANSFVYW